MRGFLSHRATVAIVALNVAVFVLLQVRPDFVSLFLLNPTLDAIVAQPWTLVTVLSLALFSPLSRVGAAAHAAGLVAGILVGYVIKRKADTRSV